MVVQIKPLVMMLAQAEVTADEFADILVALEGGREVATRFCERLPSRIAETDQLALENLVVASKMQSRIQAAIKVGLPPRLPPPCLSSSHKAITEGHPDSV